MKKILGIAIIGLLLFGCKQEVKTEHIINGNAKGVYNGIRVYLKIRNNKTKREVSIDTAIVMNEKFSFVNKLKHPELRFLTVDNVPGKLPLVIENNDMTIDINKDNITTSVVTGSAVHKDYEIYNKEITELENNNNLIVQEYRNAARAKNEELKDSLLIVLKKLREEFNVFSVDYTRDNTDKVLSLILIEQEIEKGLVSIEKCKEAFDNLDRDLRNSLKGQMLNIKIASLYQAYLIENNLEIGKMAMNFKAPNPDGEVISLDDIKGKVTIIDFWASWCGPCRRENPNVVKIYNKYHDQGLEIIGVSLDGQSRQIEPKKAWTDAIEKDNLTWHHVSNLNYFNDPVAQLYGIKAIPATYILDEDGKIVAKNLRGQALELKIKELLNL